MIRARGASTRGTPRVPPPAAGDAGPFTSVALVKQDLVASTLNPAGVVDFRDGPVVTLLLNQNIPVLTIIPPTLNSEEDAEVVLQIEEDGIGGRLIVAYSANVLFPGGVAPVLSVAPNAVDLLQGVADGTDAVIRFVPTLGFVT